ncbi:MAG: phosphopantetheine-binding protein [Sandaracinaceae bacterium]|nr:phosphopantetheine-binding protein [Sandaracinaceae bacterium]
MQLANMTRGELIALFKKMASEIAERDFSHVSEDHKIAELGIDSLAMLELVGAMERELGVQIPDEQLVGIQTVRHLIDIVERRKRVQ